MSDSMLECLISKQKELKLSDQAMAQKLRCSRVWWNQVKNRHQPLPEGMVVDAMNVFPELIPDALFFLRQQPNPLFIRYKEEE